MAFRSAGRRNKDTDTRIGTANAVLCKLYRSVITKRELSNTAKLSVFKSVSILILTYGYESWVMAEKMLYQVQPAEMGYLLRFHGVTLSDKVHSCEIPTSPYRMISAPFAQPCVHNVPGKIDKASSAGYTYGKAAQTSTKDQVA